MSDSVVTPEPRQHDLSLFMALHGRFPRIGDKYPPWHFRGWLAAYVQAIHAAHPEVSDRWGYLFEIMESGKLPKDPIPQIRFDRDPTVSKSLEKYITITSEYGRRGFGWEAFRSFLDWLSWGLGTSSEYPKLDDATQEKLYRAVDLGPWLLSPYDYLGEYAAEVHGSGWNPNAFYPTPHAICELMIRMTFDSGQDLRTRSVMDPALGTGRFLLHASNHSLYLFGQDIDPLMCQITLINGALYAPWIVRPPPEGLMSPAKQRIMPPRNKGGRAMPPRRKMPPRRA